MFCASAFTGRCNRRYDNTELGGVFTCSGSNFKTCFIGILCATDSVGSVASSELPCSVVVARLSVASLMVAPCFPRDSRRFIPVEIKDQFTVITKKQVLKRQTSF